MTPRVLPASHLHEAIDVARSFGAKVHVIGMLVHVERQDRRAASQCVAMIGRPLIDQLAIAWRPRQQHPSRTAAERFAHGDEFGAPTLKGPKIADDGLAQRAFRIALIAQPVKEQLVQDHRIHRDQLFALKSVDQETGCFVEFELLELFIDKVEALNCAAIIVLVMADDEPLRHAFDPSRIAGQRFHRVWHGRLLNPLNCATARKRCAYSAHAPSPCIRSRNVSVCSVPTKRNLLDKASAAQSLDGNRLTGSLLVPGPRLYSPDYRLTSEGNVRFASLANVEMPSLGVCFTSQKRTLVESTDTSVCVKRRLVYCDELLRATRRTCELISAGLWSTSFFMLSG